jgi:biopolymer transport protein ExbD|tara:strand:+ start:874 stop:1311 length:438 start_codon:yes stop_codon:yes gene_type:complete
MKFRRQYRLICDVPGAAPFGCVMFLLLFYLINNSALLLVEGVPVHLPEGTGRRPTGFEDSVVVAMDEQHRLFYLNQELELPKLQLKLEQRIAGSENAKLLLVLKVDRTVNHQAVMQVAAAAQNAGVRQIWLATRPRLFEQSPRRQ